MRRHIFFVLISANAKIEKLWGTTNGSMIVRRCENRARSLGHEKNIESIRAKKRRSAGVTTLAKARAGLLLVSCYTTGFMT